METNNKRYLENWSDERNSAMLYSFLAENEKDSRLSEVYNRLAATEIRHADRWERLIKENGGKVPSFKPTWRTKTLCWLAKNFGVEMVLPTVVGIEDKGTDGYKNQPEAQDFISEERSHSNLLKQISRTGKDGLEGGMLAKLEGRHKSAGGNALRAAVLGASDGLLSNFNLIMGVAGASAVAATAVNNKVIMLTGMAGLLAGAISMALGEWISVQSSRELYLRQIETERFEIEAAPEEELEELVLIYQARGLDDESARLLASRLMANPDTALDALVRDELGIDPDELGGSAWEAALTSFALFALGAVIPLLPFLFTSGYLAIGLSAGASAIGLFMLGAAITLFTNKPIFYSGMRQVFFGLIAAGAVYLVGHLIGVQMAG
ncbi:MAG: VIT1/CCC1 transporter family protein [Bacteroidetes bacterium]|nr:VIT1/CCC1 transporter family protein [Bacteroidota bacterium]